MDATDEQAGRDVPNRVESRTVEEEHTRAKAITARVRRLGKLSPRASTLFKRSHTQTYHHRAAACLKCSNEK